MKNWIRSHKRWTTVLVLGLLIALCGLPWSLTLQQRRDMAAVQEYIKRLQPQIANDPRFQDVRLLGYHGDDPFKPYIATTGTVRLEQDWASLERFLRNSKPPIPISTRSVLVRRPVTNFTGYLHRVQAITPEGGVVFWGGPTRQPTAEMASQHLQFIRLFAFGGLGRAGPRSSGEQALRVILMGTNAVDMLLDIAAKGTTEAKLYALFGIRKLRSPEFDRLAAALLTKDRSASTAMGCVFSPQPVWYIVDEIKAGRFDTFQWRPDVE